MTVGVSLPVSVTVPPTVALSDWMLLAAVLATVGGTAGAALYWLADGDLHAAVNPVLQQWDADTLARDAGFEDEDAATP